MTAFDLKLNLQQELISKQKALINISYFTKLFQTHFRKNQQELK
jgi:hypothetical protein